MNDNREKLDLILADWHSFCRGFSPVPIVGASAMFRASRSRAWDTSGEIADAAVHKSEMETVEFEVGEMADPHRSAIHIAARNLWTGRSLWSHPRLPTDPLERGAIVGEARKQLTARLTAAGVL